ncbi:MAG: DNA primase [Candidatus Margulisiibacteriota bacterium]
MEISLIPKEKIEEIKEKADIVSIISDYLPLKKRGKNYLALCPFHSEKTASFTVSQEKQLFHCFGCGEGGNVFAFVMKTEKVEFPEAVEIVGEKLGIRVEKTKGSGILKNYRDRIYDILSLACKFYESNLDSNSGAHAREYIEKRKLSADSLKSFRLGFAEDSFSSLTKHLLSRGAKAEDIEAAGLALPGKESGYYDRFRNRLMFPIFDLRGHIVGFSGRALNDEQPKYLNSPDSIVFNKGDVLFGLNLAIDEVKKRKFAILVEGNIDVVSCHEAGFKNTVAPLGTALTLNQAKLLKRFAETAVLAFDSDAAGYAAMERAHEVLSEAELLSRVLELGKFKDPDELIKSAGKDAFAECVKSSVPATEFKIKRIISRFNLSEVEGRARAAYEVAGLMAKEKNQIVQREYIKYAAGLLKTEEDLLSAEVKKRTFYKRSSGQPLRSITKRPPEKISEAEKNLLNLALSSDEAFGLIKDGLETDEFSDPNYREIFKKLQAVPAGTLLSELESEEQKRIVREAMLAEPAQGDVKQMVKDCINTVKGYQVKKHIDKVRQDLMAEEKIGNLDAVKRLNSEYHSLSEILRTMCR